MLFFKIILSLWCISTFIAQAATAAELNKINGCPCGTTQFHSGQDWTSPPGSAIPAAYDGEIVEIELNKDSVDYNGGTGFCGRYVVILHTFPNGKFAYTRYAQIGNTLNEELKPIQVGAMVKKGQSVGQVGRTGILHFEVRPFSTKGLDWRTVDSFNPDIFDFEKYGEFRSQSNESIVSVTPSKITKCADYARVLVNGQTNALKDSGKLWKEWVATSDKMEAECPGIGFDCRSFLSQPEKNKCVPFKREGKDDLLKHATYK